MRSELAEIAFVTHCFSMEQSQRKVIPKPNNAEVQLPLHMIPQEFDRYRKAMHRRYCDTVKTQILSVHLRRGDGEIRATKRYRGFGSTAQVHGAVLP